MLKLVLLVKFRTRFMESRIEKVQFGVVNSGEEMMEQMISKGGGHPKQVRALLHISAKQ